MITEITRQALRRLFNELEWINLGDPFFLMAKPKHGFNWWGDLDEIKFLDRLYDLDDLPSTDARYENARGDIIQHRVNNLDWSDDWVFDDERFLKTDSQWLSFLAETLHPVVRQADEVSYIRAAFNQLLRLDRLEIYQESQISGRAVYAGGPARPRNVSTGELRDAIGQAVRGGLKSYHVEHYCDSLSLPPLPHGSEADPHSSKAYYVGERIQDLDLSPLISLARRVNDDHPAHELAALLYEVDLASIRSVEGEPKNLIFADNGPKPELVLVDAVNNDIQITKNANYCLVYDRPIEPETGVSWQALVDWWTDEIGAESPTREVALALHQRLIESLAGNEAEQLILTAYARFYASQAGFSLPALIPQVYLHYDPYTLKHRGRAGPLERQRMDFLLLMPRRRRIVIELDGKQHHTNDHGQPSPAKYAAMVAEDRRLQLEGYDVFRFGGHEFINKGSASTMLHAFFSELLAGHDLSIT